MGVVGEEREGGGEREEIKRTTKSMQIETGDIMEIRSVPMDSSMLPSIFVWGKVGGGGLGRSHGRSLTGGERERERINGECVF